MSAWYEAEEELESLLEEEARRFPRAKPPGREAPRRPSPALRPTGRGRPKQPPARRRLPWIIYGTRPPGFGPVPPVPAPLWSRTPPSQRPPEEPPSEEPIPPPAPEPSDEPSAEPAQVESEYHAPRGPLSVRISSWASRQLTGLPPQNIPKGGGLYIVVQKMGPPAHETVLPIYVGETQDFQSRWLSRLQAVHQIGLTDSRKQLPRPLTVLFGLLAPGFNTAAIRKGVEHALIRLLQYGGNAPSLRNASSINRFVTADLVKIENLLPVVLVPSWAQQLARQKARVPELKYYEVKSNTLHIPNKGVKFELLGG